MKKALIAIAAVVMTVSASYAQIYYESFDYTSGSTLATSPSTNGNWLPLNTGTAPQVASGSLNVFGLQSSIGNSVSWGAGNIQEAYSTISPSVNTGLLYYSFAFQLTALPTSTTYSFSLMQPGSTTNYGSSIWLKANGSGFNIGLDNRTAAPSSNYAAPTYNLNETIFVVGAYEFVSGASNDVSRLWINPSYTDFGALSAPSATITATGGTDLTGVNGFLLRGASGSPSGKIDELRMGTTWASVTPVPEPSSGALLVLGGAALVAVRSLRKKNS